MNSQRISVSVDAVDPQRAAALASGLAALGGVEVLSGAAAKGAGLTLLALGVDPAADLALMGRLSEQGQAEAVLAPVMLVGPAPAPELLLAAMRAGITEYLPEPVAEVDLRAAYARLQARRILSNPAAQTFQGQGQGQAPAPGNGGRILLVLGAKGGVGTTTVAVNLADALTRLGTGRTALVDLAQPQGETPIFLDLEHTYTWADVAQNIERLDATYLESVMARHHSGLAVLPAPGFQAESALEPAVLRQILELLRRSYAQVIVDAGTGHDEAALEALDLADEVLLVLDLSLPCLARAKRFLEAVRASRPQLLSRLRLVANRKTSESDIGTAEAEGILQQRIAFAVVNDYKSALSAINQGKTLAEADPRSAMAKGLAAMARDLCQSAPALAAPAGASGSLWARLRNTPLGLSLAPRSA